MPSHTNLDRSIFREYDIRGIVDQNLTTETAYLVGKAFGTFLKEKNGQKIGLCYDGRHSSPSLAQNLIKGLTETGIRVENYGLAPTPLVYFALDAQDLDAGIVITGSHNPPDYNGIKMALRQRPVTGDEIRALYDMISHDAFKNGAGHCENISLYNDYIARLIKDYDTQRKPPLKVVWDAGNGATGAVLKDLTDKISGEHILLYDKVDGHFPNHHPDPSKAENLQELIQTVIDQKADLGIAFDGDGDRMGAVDRHGNIIWGDQLLALFARDTLTRYPKAPILMDVKCSHSIFQLIQSWGGNPVYSAVGHSLAKAKMKETGAPLGGELSGHIYIKDGFTGHDDGLYCAIRLLNIIHRFGDLAEQRKIFPTVYNTPEIRFEVPEDDKFQAIERIKKNLENKNGIDVLNIDGVRVTSPEGWYLIRASNTQPMLTIRAESESKSGLKTVIKDLKTQLEKAEVSVPNDLKA